MHAVSPSSLSLALAVLAMRDPQTEAEIALRNKAAKVIGQEFDSFLPQPTNAPSETEPVPSVCNKACAAPADVETARKETWEEQCFKQGVPPAYKVEMLAVNGPKEHQLRTQLRLGGFRSRDEAQAWHDCKVIDMTREGFTVVESGVFGGF